MPITLPEVTTRPKVHRPTLSRPRFFAALIVLVSGFFVARRTLLVLLLGAKILGYGAALDGWEGAVTRKTVTQDGIAVDIYQGATSGSPLLIVHGLNPTGKDSLDLIRISQALAQSGYQVYVPDIADLKKQKLRPEAVGSVRAIFRSIGQDAAIACFSYGCGPALIAAMHPEIHDHVRFVFAFGGYFDIREAFEFLVTGPPSPLAYGKWVYLAANADLVTDEQDQWRIRRIAEARAQGHVPDPAIEAGISAAGRPLIQLFSATTPADFRVRLELIPEPLRRMLDELSPSHFTRQLRAPLILVHGANDYSIPAQQSVELAQAAQANGIQETLTLLRMYGHTNPTLPKPGLQTIVGFYIPEAYRFFSVINHVVSLR
jgi:pimeloyl-ACP methyl ester carboxylesterase